MIGYLSRFFLYRFVRQFVKNLEAATKKPVGMHRRPFSSMAGKMNYMHSQ
jgi:hypothetical protein